MGGPASLVVLLVFALCAWSQSAGPASSVLGQGGAFTTASINYPSGSAGAPGPQGVHVPGFVRSDALGNAFVCDAGVVCGVFFPRHLIAPQGNHRVVRFPAGTSTADAVWV